MADSFETSLKALDIATKTATKPDAADHPLPLKDPTSHHPERDGLDTKSRRAKSRKKQGAGLESEESPDITENASRSNEAPVIQHECTAHI